MIKSKVDGVHFSATKDRWLARTPGKRGLYCGPDMEEAEIARLAWDKQRTTIQPQAKPRKHTEKYKHVFNPYWIPTIAGYGLEGAWEQ